MKIQAIQNTYSTGIKPKQNSLTVQSYNKDFATIPAGKISYIYFTGINKIEPTPFLKSTIKTIDELYAKYEKNLMETPESDIEKWVNEISAETNFKTSKVLKAMSDVTQFASISSLRKIGKTLNENGIGIIGNSKNRLVSKFGETAFPDNFKLREVAANDKGLHGTLDYLLNEKKILPLDEKNKNIAIFLEKSKIGQLEELKKTDEDSFYYLTTNPHVKFFMLSGWDSGVTFLDKTKSIKDLTKARLKTEQSDQELLKRVSDLGLSPVIITNKAAANVESIHKHISPLKMTKHELHTLIDANVQERVSGEKNFLIAKDISANYIKDSLNVYSPERMSFALKDLHTQITSIVKNHGKSEKDVIYIIPEKAKSYDYVNYSYQKINSVPDSQFKTIEEIEKDSNIIKDKIGVVLDDCSMSGNSLKSITYEKLNNNAIRSADEIIFSCIYATEEAIREFSYNKVLNNSEIITKDKGNIGQYQQLYHPNDVRIVIGNTGYCYGEHCQVFPYMSPDNNSDLASNIALLHNVNYRFGNKKDYINTIFTAIKSPSARIMKVEKKYKDLEKTKSDYELTSVETPIALNLKSLSKIEMWKKYKEIAAEMEFGCGN